MSKSESVLTASQWHGGQWSALYSFASTGYVWDEDHRSLLTCEVEKCLRTSNLADAEAEALSDLLAYVENAPLKSEEDES